MSYIQQMNMLCTSKFLSELNLNSLLCVVISNMKVDIYFMILSKLNYIIVINMKTKA